MINQEIIRLLKIADLSEENRKEFLDELDTMTPDEKESLLSMLKKKI